MQFLDQTEFAAPVAFAQYTTEQRLKLKPTQRIVVEDITLGLLMRWDMHNWMPVGSGASSGDWDFSGEWEMGRTYTTNPGKISVVTRNGNTYGCIVAHVSGEFTVPNNGGKWKEVWALMLGDQEKPYDEVTPTLGSLALIPVPSLKNGHLVWVRDQGAVFRYDSQAIEGAVAPDSQAADGKGFWVRLPQ